MIDTRGSSAKQSADGVTGWRGTWNASIRNCQHFEKLPDWKVEMLLAGWGVISACALRPILLNKADSQVRRLLGVLAGDLFVYKVAEPQRATLAVALTASTDMPGRSNWIFSELQGPGNREVKPETYRHVTAWLRDAGNHEHPSRLTY